MDESCLSCGAPVNPGVRFCAKCGAAVSPPVVVDPLPAPQVTTTRPSAAKTKAVGVNPLVLGAMGLVVVALAVGGTYYVARRSAPPPPSALAPAPPVVVTQAPESDVRPMMDLANDYEAMQAQADQANKKVAQLLKNYQRRGGKLPPNFSPDLNDEQRTLLADRIQQERAGVRNLLQDIIDRDAEVKSLRVKASTLSARLPAHVTVAEGDRQDRIVMDYLIKQRVPADKAYQIVSEVNLQESMLPGFTVWIYYEHGQFGTWVTKGTASITPQEHAQRLKALLQNELDEAVHTATVLKQQLGESAAQVDEARKQAEAASGEAGAMLKIAEEERAKNAAIENTLRYAVGSKKDLVSRKAITKDMGVLSFDRASVTTIDVSATKNIGIDATTFGLKKIKKLTLLPAVFAQGVDYEVTIDGALAQVRLVNVDKFRRGQMIIVVE